MWLTLPVLGLFVPFPSESVGECKACVSSSSVLLFMSRARVSVREPQLGGSASTGHVRDEGSMEREASGVFWVLS